MTMSAGTGPSLDSDKTEAIPDLSHSQVAMALDQIKRDARDRRIALVAPLALAAALIGAFVAAPPRYGGVPIADAGDTTTQWPRVFGANGVWRLAEPITSAVTAPTGAPWVVELPQEPAAPSYSLAAPESLSASASPPPAPTLGQPHDEFLDAAELAVAAVDWSAHRLQMRVVAPEPIFAPDASAPAEVETGPDSSPVDEDVTAESDVSAGPTGDTAAYAAAVADTGDQAQANPSTPGDDQADSGAQPSSAVATIALRSVLVHSAHVSVTVQVVDDDSSVIDWCNTRVDWGDGSVTGLPDPDGPAACAARCEQAIGAYGVGTSPEDLGQPNQRLATELVFTHEFDRVLDVAPRIFVATGDGCNYTLAELQLPEFTVAPY